MMHSRKNIKMRWRVFTARYGLGPYIKQKHFVFEGLISVGLIQWEYTKKCSLWGR